MATVEELREEFRARRLSYVAHLAQAISRYVESPIEEMLLWAFLNRHIMGSDVSFVAGVAPSSDLPGGLEGRDFLLIAPESDVGYEYCLQPTVMVGKARYRIDLVLSLGWIGSAARKPGEIYVAIECDGHEFHEKTREQAQSDKQRDRDLQSLGYLVARFTGSEIVRDPVAATCSVARLVEARLKATTED